MNGGQDDKSRERDRLAVAAIYRQIADETAPDELNKSVLRHAQKQSQGVTSRALTWLRPVAIAATLALSVALVLQVGFLGSGTSPGDFVAPVTPGEKDDIFDAAADTSMEQIRAAESAAQLSPGTSESLTTPRSQVEPAPTPGDVSPESQACSPEQRSSSITWWECIQVLEKRGMSGTAAQELEALFEAHPAFGVRE